MAADPRKTAPALHAPMQQLERNMKKIQLNQQLQRRPEPQVGGWVAAVVLVVVLVVVEWNGSG
jgi:hypothetical protein